MKLTIVLPTYNEAENLKKIVSALLDLPISNLNLLIVDDNSPDGTVDIAEGLSVEFSNQVSVMHRKGKLGLGTAYIQGFEQALKQGAEVVGQMDSDFSHPPQKLIEMLSALADYDVVLGSRYVNGGSVDDTWPRWRKGLSSFGKFLCQNKFAITCT